MIVEIILRQYVKADLVNEFMRIRSLLKKSPLSKPLIQLYKQRRKAIKPKIEAARESLQRNIKEMEKRAILSGSRAAGTEITNANTLKNDIRALNHYLYF